MDFENKPLKSAKEIAMERSDEIIEKTEKSQKEKPLKTSVQIAMERADLMLEKAKSNEDDIEKIKELADKNGFDLSETIEEKNERIKKSRNEKEWDGILSEALKDFSRGLNGVDMDKQKIIDEKMKLTENKERSTMLSGALQDFSQDIRNIRKSEETKKNNEIMSGKKKNKNLKKKSPWERFKNFCFRPRLENKK